METFHVDGFRFDLAPVMGRAGGSASRRRCLRAIKNCPVLSRVKLIAEPWDIGERRLPGGNFPPLFAEWNDHYRDAVRRFWLEKPVAGRSSPDALPLPAICLNVMANDRLQPSTW